MSRRERVLGLSALALLLAAASGCERTPSARAGEGAVAGASFGDAFDDAGRVRLEEPDSALITGIEKIAVGPGGRLAVPDREQDRVRLYSADGSLVADLGGTGAGPGELRSPEDAVFGPDGSLWVSDAGNGRLARFGPDGAYRDVLPVRDAYYAADLEVAGDRVLAFLARAEAGARSVRAYGPDGRERATFHPRRPAYQRVPYWTAAHDHLLATSEGHLVAGGNLRYPLVHYGPDGSLRDSIGRPPPSWSPAPKPERGAFSGPDRFRAFERWRRTFTTIDRLALYRDSLLVVSHRQLDPEVLAYEDAVHRADVYRLDGTKLLEDVRLPGRLLAGGRHLYVLLSRAPGPWVVGRFRIDSGRPSRVASGAP